MKITKKWLELAERQTDGGFYIFDEDRYVENVKTFRSNLRSYYPNTQFAHSYKTNYTPYIVRVSDRMGLYSEVVSRAELEIALFIGIEPSRIIFNGPIKSGNDIKYAFEKNVVINVDSLLELEMVVGLAEADPKKSYEFGLRVGFDLAEDVRTRFGICLESGDYEVALRKIRSCPNIKVIGLHCHFSVGDRNAEAYRSRLRRLVETASKLENFSEMKFLDIGGGFAGRMSDELLGEFNCDYPSYDDYAKLLGSEMARSFPNGGPELIVEPGMGVLAESMKFACRVHAIKNTSRGCVAIANGSIFNIKPFLHKKNIPFERFADSDQKKWDAIDITGYTCMEVDVLYRGYSGALEEGDFIVFENCGAYTSVLLPDFIRMPPAILLYAASASEPTIIKRAHETNDVLSTYL